MEKEKEKTPPKLLTKTPHQLLPLMRKECEDIEKILQKIAGTNEETNKFTERAIEIKNTLIRCEKEYGDLKNISEEIEKVTNDLHTQLCQYHKDLKHLETRGFITRFISQVRLRSNLEQDNEQCLLLASTLEMQIKDRKLETVLGQSNLEFNSLLEEMEKLDESKQEKGKEENSMLHESWKILEDNLSIVSDAEKREALIQKVEELSVKPLMDVAESNLWSADVDEEKEKYNDFLAAQSVSTYPFQADGKREGDPICDQYAAIRWENRLLLALADGCSWGEAPKEAARKITRMFLSYMKKNQHLIKSTREAALMLLRAFNLAHKSIIYKLNEETLYLAGTSTLIAGIVLELKEPHNSSEFVFVGASIGDCKAFLYSEQEGRAKEINLGGTNNRDPRDPGGRLGPYLENGKPDLRNLRVFFHFCNRGDILFLVTDGIHDNFEPQQLGISPSEFGLQSPTNNWAQFKDQIFPPHVEQRISDWSHQKLNETITAQKPVTPLKICRSLIDYVKQLTEPTRIFYNTNPGKKTPPNHQNYPGKLDHSTCLCGKIGPSNLSVEDLCKDIFGNEGLMSWSSFIKKLAFSKTEEKHIKPILDFQGTLVVKSENFRLFLKGFGPLNVCAKNAEKLANADWFKGYLTRSEASTFLQSQPVGTFLVRISSKPGSFSLDYVSEQNKVSSILLSVHEGGWTQDRLSSLEEVIESCKKKGFISSPLKSTINKKDWFYGEISREEAEQLLQDKEPGTFIIRMSSEQGSYAATFVNKERQVKNGKIKNVGGQYQVEGEGNKYSTLEDLVQFYKSKEIFVRSPRKVDYQQ